MLQGTPKMKKAEKKKLKEDLESEKHIQDAILQIKKRYGKNAILKGMNFEEGGTMRDRNRQNGGHSE